MHFSIFAFYYFSISAFLNFLISLFFLFSHFAFLDYSIFPSEFPSQNITGLIIVINIIFTKVYFFPAFFPSTKLSESMVFFLVRRGGML